MNRTLSTGLIFASLLGVTLLTTTSVSIESEYKFELNQEKTCWQTEDGGEKCYEPNKVIIEPTKNVSDINLEEYEDKEVIERITIQNRLLDAKSQFSIRTFSRLLSL